LLLLLCVAAGFQQHIPARNGLLLACASKAAGHQPLQLPPTAALAAALETRGHYTVAAAALRYCLALLQAGLQAGEQGLAALGLAPGLNEAAPNTLAHQLLLVPPSTDCPGHVQVLQGSSGVQAVVTAVELALARNLCLAGEAQESLVLYQKLEGEGALSAAPLSGAAASYAWLAFGAAAQQAGQGQLAMRALQAAVEVGTADPQVRLAAVSALLQVSIR
jgi:hypothetical protein